MIKKLGGLLPSLYEHPYDKEALSSFKKFPGADKAMSTLLNWGYLKWEVLKYQGSNLHVTKESCQSLYDLVQDVAFTLDVDMPKVYTKWGYYVNAFTTGYQEDTLLVLYSGAVDILTESELRFVIGHEMGHIKSKHVIYHMLATISSGMAASFMGSEFLSKAMFYELMRWNRMSELSADRAGLLACQDINVAIDTMMRMAGIPNKCIDKANRDAFIKQAHEFEFDMNSIVDKAAKAILILDANHPWIIMRAHELLKWYESGEYKKILDGNKSCECIHCGHSPIDPQSSRCPICGLNPFE